MTEEWKDIEGFPGYRVSNSGRVWSEFFAGCFLIQEITHRGYYRVTLSGQKHAVHRLVASHFIPNPENKPTVNHIDKDKTNNCISNLEWSSYAEQIEHRDRYLTPLIIQKGGIEYQFWCRQDILKTLPFGKSSLALLLSGEKESIKGFKIKNVAGV